MIEVEERRPWRVVTNLLVIGPGGAGKSSLGAELGPQLKRRVVDLDQEFLRRIGDIDTVIRKEGYENYKLRNSMLATEVAGESDDPILLAASSGFLTPDNPKPALEANRRLLAASYSLCLLPSRDFEQAVRIIVERQLRRPFSRDRVREEATIRDRYPLYANEGDLMVFSVAPSRAIALAIARHLSSDN